MTVAVLITSHQRPQMLSVLLSQIHKQCQSFCNVRVIVAIDGRQSGYEKVFTQLNKLFPWKHNLVIPESHRGKEKYWELVTMLYKQAEIYKSETDYYIQLPDDVELDDMFFMKAIDQFRSINDDQKICLNLINDGRNQPGWTRTKQKSVVFGAYRFNLTGWVDMCFISRQNFFDVLNFKIRPVAISWAADPERSSGVGMQISRRLVESGFKIYQVGKSLVSHSDHTSQMHPEHRKKVPLICKTESERVIAGMASLAGREESLKEAVSSLIRQVDELHITLNGYHDIPEFLLQEKIKIRVDHLNSLGDAAKFSILGKTGYLFTCDDDIIYPADYVVRMISKIEQYKRKAIVTLHGRTFQNLPVRSYYHSGARVIRCLDTNLKDEFIQVPGTGVTAFHSSTIDLKQSDFKAANMSDIWLGVAAQNHRVPVVNIAHKRGWIKESLKYDVLRSIHARLHKRDQYQAQVVNSVNWQLYDSVG